jgi:hypothetical protein
VSEFAAKDRSSGARRPPLPGAVEADGPALRSGVPVLTRHRPGAEVTTVTVWVLAGARHEGDRPGVTHLLEHVLMRADLPGLGDPHAVAALGGEAGAVAALDAGHAAGPAGRGHRRRGRRLRGRAAGPAGGRVGGRLSRP